MGTAERTEFGRLKDGTLIDAVTLRNEHGLAAKILTYGATVARLDAPDRTGRIESVVLGFDTLEGYLGPTGYLGALIGRYANRIAGGRFVLDRATHKIATDRPPNALHGGSQGFDKRVWRIDEVSQGTEPSLDLSLVSADGDQGFPGRLAVQVRYRLQADALRIDYAAATDRATVVNLTNHAYFNLAGSGDVLGHELTIHADAFTPVNGALIPTGEIRAVDGTPFDFRTPHPIGARIRTADEQLRIAHGYDHNFALRSAADGSLVLAAVVRESRCGRILEVWTTEPGLQFYSGNFLDGSITGSGGRLYRQSDGFCLETQHFPDSPNHAHFPSTVLRPGEEFRSATLFRFATDGG